MEKSVESLCVCVWGGAWYAASSHITYMCCEQRLKAFFFSFFFLKSQFKNQWFQKADVMKMKMCSLLV